MKRAVTPLHGRTVAGLMLLMGLCAAALQGTAHGQPDTPLDELKAMAADTVNAPDLARAALLGAQMVRPDLDPDAYLALLDTMAADVAGQLQGVTAAGDAVNVLSNYLYNVRGFANTRINAADVFVGLDQVLEGRQWNCVAMSLLYAALGKRTGIPLNLVAGHGHVLVGYTGPGTFYIETTAGGRLEATRNYLRDYLPFPCTVPASYVTLDEREAIALCLTQTGIAMQADGRTQLARTFYEVALDFAPDYFEPHGGLGFILAAEGEYAEAVRRFERAIALNPEFREGYGGLGNALNALGNTARAVETYRSMVALCPDDATAIFNMGQLLYNAGDLDGSIVAYERYIELQPQDPEGYLRIAFPLEDQGNLERAAEAYNRVLALEPNHVDALTNLGHILEQVGDFSSSLEAYGRALELRPGYLQAMAGTGRVLGKTNRFNRALGIFREALRAYPGEAFLYVDLGKLFEGHGDYRQAVGAYQEATRIAPYSTEGYYAMANALENLGMNQDARLIRSQAQAVEEELARRKAAALPGFRDPNGRPLDPPPADGAPADGAPADGAPPMDSPPESPDPVPDRDPGTTLEGEGESPAESGETAEDGEVMEDGAAPDSADAPEGLSPPPTPAPDALPSDTFTETTPVIPRGALPVAPPTETPGPDSAPKLPSTRPAPDVTEDKEAGEE